MSKTLASFDGLLAFLLGATVSFTASHAENAREGDPVVVTRSFLGAWAASSVDDLMGFMASDAVVVSSGGTKYADEASVRQVIGRLKGLQNREYEVRLDGDRVAAHGKTYGYVPYVDLGVEPGESDSSTVVKNGRIVYYEWHYTPEFNAQLEQACLRKPDYMFGRTPCLDFATQAKAHTESARQK
jgi:hypothetical protein